MAWHFPKSFCHFVRRNKSKFIFTGVFIGGVVGSLKFAEYKVKQYFAAEQKKAIEDLRKQKAFDQNQLHSLALVEAMLQSIMAKVQTAVDTNAITERLKTTQGNKLELWNELKITIFAQITTSIITVVTVLIVVRAQLNQVAGYMQTSAAADEKQRKFLSYPHDHLLEKGIEELASRVYKVSQGLIESMTLQCPVTFSTLETTFRSICTSVMTLTNGDEFKVINYAFPQDVVGGSLLHSENFKKENIETWLSKVLDVLDSPDCTRVFVQCVSKGISLFSKEMHGAIAASAVSSVSQSSVISDEPSFPLAKSLPLINSKLQFICSRSFIEPISNLHILNKFCVNIYESFLSTC